MLTIISAMEEELAGVRVALAEAGGNQPDVGPPCVDFCVIGVGRGGVESNIKGLLRTHRQRPANAEAPSGLLLLGFAGGVDPSLSVGDLTLAGRYCRLVPQSRVPLVRVPYEITLQDLYRQRRVRMESRDPALPRGAVLKFLEPDPGMWQRAREALAQGGLTAIETDSMTVPEPVSDPNTKRELHRQYRVGTVNMEDYWVARLAIAAKVPFLSMRAVLDTADQRLPPYLVDLYRPDADGSGGYRLPPYLVEPSGKPRQAALHTLVRPWQIPTLLRLAHRAGLARASLTRFALEFVNHRRSLGLLPPAGTPRKSW